MSLVIETIVKFLSPHAVLKTRLVSREFDKIACSARGIPKDRVPEIFELVLSVASGTPVLKILEHFRALDPPTDYSIQFLAFSQAVLHFLHVLVYFGITDDFMSVVSTGYIFFDALWTVVATYDAVNYADIVNADEDRNLFLNTKSILSACVKKSAKKLFVWALSTCSDLPCSELLQRLPFESLSSFLREISLNNKYIYEFRDWILTPECAKKVYDYVLTCDRNTQRNVLQKAATVLSKWSHPECIIALDEFVRKIHRGRIWDDYRSVLIQFPCIYVPLLTDNSTEHGIYHLTSSSAQGSINYGIEQYFHVYGKSGNMDRFRGMLQLLNPVRIDCRMDKKKPSVKTSDFYTVLRYIPKDADFEFYEFTINWIRNTLDILREVRDVLQQKAVDKIQFSLETLSKDLGMFPGLWANLAALYGIGIISKLGELYTFLETEICVFFCGYVKEKLDLYHPRKRIPFYKGDTGGEKEHVLGDSVRSCILLLHRLYPACAWEIKCSPYNIWWTLDCHTERSCAIQYIQNVVSKRPTDTKMCRCHPAIDNLIISSYYHDFELFWKAVNHFGTMRLDNRSRKVSVFCDTAEILLTTTDKESGLSADEFEKFLVALQLLYGYIPSDGDRISCLILNHVRHSRRPRSEKMALFAFACKRDEIVRETLLTAIDLQDIRMFLSGHVRRNLFQLQSWDLDNYLEKCSSIELLKYYFAKCLGLQKLNGMLTRQDDMLTTILTVGNMELIDIAFKSFPAETIIVSLKSRALFFALAESCSVNLSFRSESAKKWLQIIFSKFEISPAVLSIELDPALDRLVLPHFESKILSLVLTFRVGSVHPIAPVLNEMLCRGILRPQKKGYLV